MKLITKELIFKDYRGYTKILSYSNFVVMGLIIFFSPLIFGYSFVRPLLTMTLISSLLGTLIFGIGLILIVKTVWQMIAIKCERYEIVSDFVTEKERWSHYDDHGEDFDYTLYFSKHYQRSKSPVSVKKIIYDSTRIGDGFYLIYVGNRVIGGYPQTEYTRDVGR